MKTVRYLALLMFIVHGRPVMAATEDRPPPNAKPQAGLSVGQAASANSSEWPTYSVTHTTAKFNASVSWDGTDGSGLSVASGIYLYRVEAGERTQTKKMVLVR
ncbi:MAG: hypothetical protein OEV49_12170 [candidate division Zixibacteria bacterium]|nr:hypothetical protein [candidate division Zixibacteria bacterium]MDH3937315.1 hypothetical protein [candidate division Zixibacteria bacterium]MDH4033091.1 hypothetical protein [candidate division Zixibacteria bacterium]